MHTSGYRGATAARSVTRGCGPRERGRRLRFDSAPPSNGVIDRLIRTPHRRCDDAPAPATRVAPDRAQRPPKLWLRANTSRHKAMSHGRMVAEAARLERECAAIIRGRVRLARADEAAPPARGAEERSGEAGAPSERL